MMTELVTFGETMLRFSPPDGERLETASEFDVRTGGAESNVAITASNLGADAAWMSKLPCSPLGRRVERDILANGVETAVYWDSDPSTRIGTYYIESGGRPRGSTVIYDRDHSAVTSTVPDDLNLDIIRDALYFCTSGITPALSEGLFETTSNLLQLAQTEDVKTVFDVNFREQLWSAAEAKAALDSLMPAVDVVCAAERDARSVLGLSGDVESVANEIYRSYDAELVLLTCGSEGALAVDDQRSYFQEAYPTDTIDSVGSGDAFLGGFLASRLEGDEIQEALDVAAAAAAISRTIDGDWPVVSIEKIDQIRDDYH